MNTFDRSQPPVPGPVRPYPLPRATRGSVANGLSVLALPHGDLPLVTAAVVADAGGSAEPEQAGGLARLTLAALEGGTARRSADRLALDLESLGVELETQATWDAAVLRVTVPRPRLDAALEILSEIVREPAFPASEVERLRDEQLADLLQRRKEPRGLANDMAMRFIFSPDTAYARPLLGSEESVARLTHDEARAFYGQRYRPGGAALLLAGAIGVEEAVHLAQRHFEGWAAADTVRADLQVLPGVQQTQVFIVHRPGSVQSEIRIGHVGVARRHPDEAALDVLNTVLGGAFTSRLNMNLRERQGFTYGVSSSFALRRHPGPFLISTAVATEVTARAVEEALRELHGVRDAAAPAEEIAAARDYLVGVLPLELQTTEQLAGQMADIFVHDLPADHLERYRDDVTAVTSADVQRAALTHLHPDRLAIVIVGDADAVGPPLEELRLGPVAVAATPWASEA
jgi:zinc protease